MNPLISIIVPVYQSERFLLTLVDSVISQPFPNWELILVDDGSTDNSSMLCDSFSNNDSRIIVIHKSNCGVSSARNSGIEAARGEWLWFCDSDDYITSDSLILFAEATKEPDIDLVTASYVRYHENELIDDTRPGENKKVSVQQYLDGTCISPHIRYNEFYIWNKLMRLSIINDYRLRFNETINYFEDDLFAYQYISHCTKSVYCLGKPVYVYFKRSIGQSASSTKFYDPQKSPGRLYAFILSYEAIKAAHISRKTEKYLKNMIIDSYFWLHYKIRNSENKYSDDLKTITNHVLHYCSRMELASKWFFRHIKLRIRQIKRALSR